jgi:hypothetical protein
MAIASSCASVFAKVFFTWWPKTPSYAPGLKTRRTLSMTDLSHAVIGPVMDASGSLTDSALPAQLDDMAQEFADEYSRILPWLDAL